MPHSKLSNGAVAILLRPRTKQPIERVVRGGKVLFYPCPDGTVRIVGVTDRGKWLGEWSCPTEIFNENMVLRMARHVMKHAARLQLLA